MNKKKVVRKQRKRTKGWRMEPDSIFVGRTGRPNKFGNPFKVEATGDGKFFITNTLNNMKGSIIYKSKEAAIKVACQMHTYFLHRKYPTDLALTIFLRPLVDKEILYCWCREDQQCHADYYIYLLNKLFYTDSNNG